jgi:hypothetical protein
VAVAVAGHRLIPFSGRMTALFVALSPEEPIDRMKARSFRMREANLWGAPNWQQAAQIVTPAPCRTFAANWRWNSRPRRIGRPPLALGPHTSAVCITTTNVARPDGRSSRHLT